MREERTQKVAENATIYEKIKTGEEGGKIIGDSFIDRHYVERCNQ